MTRQRRPARDEYFVPIFNDGSVIRVRQSDFRLELV